MEFNIKGINKEKGLELIQQEIREHAFDGKRRHLEKIQAIVDEVGCGFNLEFPQPDGIPSTMKFKPRKRRAGMLLS